MLKNVIFSRLEGLLPSTEIRRWFEPLHWDYDEDAGHLRLVAPTVFHRRHLAENYGAQLAELAAAVIAPRQIFELRLESVAAKPPAAVVLPLPEPQNEACRFGFINSGHTFEDFIINPSNRLAATALRDLADGGLNLQTGSIFIISPGPWGKTHLLNALGRRLTEEPARRFIQLSADDDFQLLPRHDHLRDLLLIIDDVHLLAERPETQRRLVRFFDEMTPGFFSLVCAAHTPPLNLQGLSGPLRSRLSGGLVLKINPPEYDLLMELAARKADDLKLGLRPETMSALVRRAENDPRRLFGFLDTIFYIAGRGELDYEEAARRLYSDAPPEAGQKRVEMNDILAATAAAFGLKVTDLTGSSRFRQAAWPRRVAMYLAKEMAGLTTTKIGEAFGNRDHSTVIHALKKIKEEIKNPAQAQMLENIRHMLITKD